MKQALQKEHTPWVPIHAPQHSPFPLTAAQLPAPATLPKASPGQRPRTWVHRAGARPPAAAAGLRSPWVRAQLPCPQPGGLKCVFFTASQRSPARRSPAAHSTNLLDPATFLSSSPSFSLLQSQLLCPGVSSPGHYLHHSHLCKGNTTETVECPVRLHAGT